MSEKQRSILEFWPVIKDDMEKFVADRPGWLINALTRAREKKGAQGWKDVEVIINILQFLRDTEVEY